MIETLRVVGCVIEYQGKILILHRKKTSSEGDTWGLPAGRVKEGESDEQAVLREVFEETGYRAKVPELTYAHTFTWNFPLKTVVFVTYKLKLDREIEVKHHPDEHQGHAWEEPQKVYLRKDLIHGFHELLEKLKYVQLL